MPEIDSRLALIHEWLSRDLGMKPERVEPASADASFRRYFRAFNNGATYIVMDAPPGKEDVRPYLKVTRLLPLRLMRILRSASTGKTWKSPASGTSRRKVP